MQNQKFTFVLLFLLGSISIARSQGIDFDGKSDTSIHDYRINLFVGVSQGINKMELGGFVNIDHKNVKYIQLAGFANFVGGDVTGIQAAGFVNTAGGAMNGLQSSGFGNYSGKDSRGIQVSGFFNSTRNMTGIQGAGFVNNARDMRGIQAAGFSNHAKSFHGIQAAGFVNGTDSNYRGIQSAGFVNYCGGDFTGLQAAGFINYAKTVKRGLQLAVINIADSSNGIPLGVFSYVKNGGYHNVEISSDEIFYTNIALRTGVRQLYNILTVGIRPEKDLNPFWTYGYGLGTEFNIAKNLDMNVEVTSNHINYSGYHPDRYFSENDKLYAGIDFHITNHISIAAGPTLNFYIVNLHDEKLINAFDNIPLPYLYDQNAGRYHDLKIWVGGKIAIRFN